MELAHLSSTSRCVSPSLLYFPPVDSKLLRFSMQFGDGEGRNLLYSGSEVDVTTVKLLVESPFVRLHPSATSTPYWLSYIHLHIFGLVALPQPRPKKPTRTARIKMAHKKLRLNSRTFISPLSSETTGKSNAWSFDQTRQKVVRTRAWRS